MSDDWNSLGDTPHDRAYKHKTQVNYEDTSDNALYAQGIELLKGLGLYLERSVTGSHCGHLVYKRSKPTPIKGINYPDWFWVLKLIETEEDESAIKSAFNSPEVSPECLAFWGPFIKPVSGNKPTPFMGYTERLIAMDGNKRLQNRSLPHDLGIQVSNFTKQVSETKKYPRAFIPPAEWFATELRELKFEDIFTLWPDAENEMLKIILGRSWVGRSNSTPIGMGGVLCHSFRNLGIIVGEDAGLGKSTVFNKLSAATNLVGYRWSNFRSISDQFGLGRIVTSDVSYKDDLTSDSLKDLIKSENTKIIASGGSIYTEDKFTKGVNVESRCTLIANTNEWNPRLVYNLDSGVVSRVKLLATFRKAEIQTENMKRCSEVARKSPTFGPYEHIPWLASELGVSEHALMLWACRLSVDKFLPMTYVDGVTLPNTKLEREVHYLSSYLRYSFNKDCTRAIISMMIFSHILVHHLSDKRLSRQPYDMKELNSSLLKEAFIAFRSVVTDKDLYRLRGLIKYHWNLTGRADTHPWAGIRKLNFTSIAEAESLFNNAINSKATLSSMVEALFGNLTLRDGFTGSKDIVWITQSWQACQGYVKSLEGLARVIDNLVETHQDGVFKSVSEGMIRVSRGRPDDGWIHSTDYSPHSVENQLAEQSSGFDETRFKDVLETISWEF